MTALIFTLPLTTDRLRPEKLTVSKPTVLKEAEARQKRILDADYSAIDLDDYAHKEMHLSTEQQEKLICSIQKYPKLFRGGLP